MENQFDAKKKQRVQNENPCHQDKARKRPERPITENSGSEDSDSGLIEVKRVTHENTTRHIEILLSDSSDCSEPHEKSTAFSGCEEGATFENEKLSRLELQMRIELEARHATTETSKASKARYTGGRFLLTRVAVSNNDETVNDGRIGLGDLIYRDLLQSAVLSSFVWDDDFVQEFLRHEVPVFMVRGERSSGNNNLVEKIKGTAWTAVFIDLKEKFGCMHSKLMILEYPDYLRICVGSGNLLPLDWGCLENIWYVHDMPRLRLSEDTQGQQCKLVQGCLDVISGFGVPVLSSFAKQHYASGFQRDPDFQGHFVVTTPGTFNDDCSNPVVGGVARLSRISSQIGTSKLALCVDAATSSLGKLDYKYLDLFARMLGCKEENSEKSEIRVRFPTAKEVLSSPVGEIAGGSIFLAEQSARALGKNILHKLESKTFGSLMHAKVLVALKKDLESGKSEVDNNALPIGFYYAGSHNFTKAAWGYPAWGKAFSGENMRMSACNYELGIVFPIFSRSEINTKFPVLFKMELGKYNEAEGDEPWTQAKHLTRKETY